MLAIKLLKDKIEAGQAAIAPSELARLVGVAPPTAYAWCARGLVRSYRIEGVRRIGIDDAIEFLRERATS